MKVFAPEFEKGQQKRKGSRGRLLPAGAGTLDPVSLGNQPRVTQGSAVARGGEPVNKPGWGSGPCWFHKAPLGTTALALSAEHC